MSEPQSQVEHLAADDGANRHAVMNKPIQILAPRLANQIAAGEVVERPASVVKELVENAMDAGSSKIEVEIERGGHKLIRVRDNGSGIAKTQLALALSRHATSKIASLDDLEAICSLGFRGEALASISAVSRLTLTSRTAEQSEAWECYAQGRDMQVEVRPAAHPVGTSVSVADLFFNTPARRKFLRTEKTEFGHIDELLKRIALSRFGLHLILKHNGKIVRQYRPADNFAAKERRLASVFSRSFIEASVYFRNEHNGLTLHGWLGLPCAARAQSDWQYCYVNGRMMRDKLINHAIRQAFGNSIISPNFPVYLLYIDLPAAEVDVNVHPAKHEVRFHQARLVHDYIVQVLQQALQQPLTQTKEQVHSAVSRQEHVSSAAGSQAQAAPPQPRHDYSYTAPAITASVAAQSTANAERAPANGIKQHRGAYQPNRSATEQLVSYRQFLASTAAITLPDAEPAMAVVANEVTPDTSPAVTSHWAKPLSLQQQQLLLLEKEGALFWLALRPLWAQLTARHLLAQWQNNDVVGAPLLLPVRVEKACFPAIEKWQPGLKRLGIEVNLSSSTKLIVTQLPAPCRAIPAQRVLQWLSEALALWPDDADQLLASGELEAQKLLPLLCLFTFHAAESQCFEWQQAVSLFQSGVSDPELLQKLDIELQSSNLANEMLQRVDVNAVIAQFQYKEGE